MKLTIEKCYSMDLAIKPAMKRSLLPIPTLVTSLSCLWQLLTRLGRKMAEFPLEPQLSKMLITRWVRDAIYKKKPEDYGQ